MMTIEEKAKAYDEALEDMRVIYPNLKCDAKLAVEHAFPQLRESEDERIRKEIIKFIQDFCNPCDPDCDKWIAYLEKQKEQKPAEWSDEDERMLSRCIKSVECSKQFADSESYKAAKDVEMNWLKSLRPSWKPNEEQMDRLFSIVAALRKDYCDDMADFLASLYEQLKKL